MSAQPTEFELTHAEKEILKQVYSVKTMFSLQEITEETLRNTGVFQPREISDTIKLLEKEARVKAHEAAQAKTRAEEDVKLKAAATLESERTKMMHSRAMQIARAATAAASVNTTAATSVRAKQPGLDVKQLSEDAHRLAAEIQAQRQQVYRNHLSGSTAPTLPPMGLSTSAMTGATPLAPPTLSPSIPLPAASIPTFPVIRAASPSLAQANSNASSPATTTGAAMPVVTGPSASLPAASVVAAGEVPASAVTASAPTLATATLHTSASASANTGTPSDSVPLVAPANPPTRASTQSAPSPSTTETGVTTSASLTAPTEAIAGSWTTHITAPAPAPAPTLSSFPTPPLHPLPGASSPSESSVYSASSPMFMLPMATATAAVRSDTSPPTSARPDATNHLGVHQSDYSKRQALELHRIQHSLAQDARKIDAAVHARTTTQEMHELGFTPLEVNMVHARILREMEKECDRAIKSLTAFRAYCQDQMRELASSIPMNIAMSLSPAAAMLPRSTATLTPATPESGSPSALALAARAAKK